jgi:hypothetical protein
MFTTRGAPPSPRGGRRANRAALAALLGTLAASLAWSSASSRTGQHVLAGYGRSGSEQALVSKSAPSTPQAQLSRQFSIAGKVAGLFPGNSRPLVVTVKNPYPFEIVVTSITTTVKQPSAACIGSNLGVGGFSGHLLVPAFGTAKTTVVAALAQSAPDACIGAIFPLTYNGFATVVLK